MAEREMIIIKERVKRVKEIVNGVNYVLLILLLFHLFSLFLILFLLFHLQKHLTLFIFISLIQLKILFLVLFVLLFFSTFTQTSLCVSFNTIQTTHNITTNRLVFRDCSSLSTTSLFEELQITPFASTFGRSPRRNVSNSGTCVSSVTFNIVIIVYCLDVVNTIQFNVGLVIEHLQESAVRLIAET